MNSYQKNDVKKYIDDCNNESIKIIVEAINNSETLSLPALVVFVGAGISQLMPYECASWKKLANDLIEKCFIEKIIDDHLKDELLQEIDSKRSITIARGLLEKDDKRNIFLESVRDSLKFKQCFEKKDGDPYSKIRKISDTVITTNADLHIDKYWSASNIKYTTFDHRIEKGKLYTTFDHRIEKGKLYKIHGSIEDPDSMVFTTSDYLNRYKIPESREENCVPNFLTRVFKDRDSKVLFIGYGLAEFEVLDYLFKGLQGTQNKFFLINGYYEHQMPLKEANDHYYKALGVTQMIYLKNESGYEGIHTILDKIIDDGARIISDTPSNNLLSALVNPYDE